MNDRPDAPASSTAALGNLTADEAAESRAEFKPMVLAGIAAMQPAARQAERKALDDQQAAHVRRRAAVARRERLRRRTGRRAYGHCEIHVHVVPAPRGRTRTSHRRHRQRLRTTSGSRGDPGGDGSGDGDRHHLVLRVRA